MKKVLVILPLALILCFMVGCQDKAAMTALEEAFEGLKLRVTMFPDQSFQVQDLFIKGDKFVFRGIFSGTHAGDIEGFPATGKKVEMRGFMIMRVENGKIVEGWGITDTLDLYQQLGFELKQIYL